MIEKVLELAAALGKTEADETLRALCVSAIRELAGQLRRGLTPEDCGQAFPLAAAWLALSGRELSESGGVKRFTAGEVTMEKSDARLRQEALRLQARQVIKPYLRDEGFSFRGVRG